MRSTVISVHNPTKQYRLGQLLIYATPVAYQLSFLKGKSFAAWITWNPLTPIVETFRYTLFATATLDTTGLKLSLCFITLMLFIALFTFSKLDRTFIDTV